MTQLRHIHLLHVSSSKICVKNTEKKLRGLSPRANYTDRATVACRQS
jgi:hypothetical protein